MPDETRSPPPEHRARRPALRILVLLALALGTLAVFASGLDRFLDVEALRAHRVELTAWIDAHRWPAAATFVLVYAAAVVFVPPSATMMTVIGGFLFGIVTGSIAVVLGATLGATLLFLAARFVAGDWLRRRAGPAVARMRAGFRAHALSYMLVLRLVPLFPFWLVNLAPAFLDVPLRTFVLGTAVGIVPGTLVFAAFGAGLGGVLDRGEAISLASVATPEIVAALIGLAGLSMAPVVLGRWTRSAADRRDRE